MMSPNRISCQVFFHLGCQTPQYIHCYQLSPRMHQSCPGQLQDFDCTI